MSGISEKHFKGSSRDHTSPGYFIINMNRRRPDNAFVLLNGYIYVIFCNFISNAVWFLILIQRY